MRPSFAEALRFWLKLGFISFGGPTGQIAIMQSELVERRKWISQGHFLHALNYCMLLPGPEAQQLAVYVGWILHGVPGGLAAGTLFVLPSVFILWGLSYTYAAYGTVPVVAGLLYGLKPAVMAIVAAAVLRIGQKALRNRALWGIAGASFAAIYFLRAPFPLIIAAAAVAGLIGGRVRRDWFSGGGHGEGAVDEAREVRARPLVTVLVGLVLWTAPMLAAGWWMGWDGTLFKLGVFFSKAAMVTFGGAYAVLPYVAQQAVEQHGWLSATQMMDGLGLAETTPGPLIMVLQFVGFMAGWNHPQGLPPILAATLGALLTTWVTFVPCFIWIFLGAPYVERLRGHLPLTSALTAITAAVVGVILNLAVWFGMHALLPAGRLDGFVLVTSVALFALMRWRRWDVIPVVFVGAALGLAWTWVRSAL